ncbi:MAG: hypothetical protein CMI00_12500 [Oceanospirillaceae bacterium]|nr:hypothetical protein [Oceanospirillaceae bacterium]|tara:strand:+ start:2015 stop:2539 length:525 start_codon:yes stop_codon:yes gene_type:complete
MTMLVRDLFDDAPLAGQLQVSMETERLLREPINIAQDWQRAERLLHQVRAELPRATEVKIALYKMYAYAFRTDESLVLIHEALAETAAAAGFSPDWQTLSLADINYRYPLTGATRMFLYTLKALGFVSMRHGDLVTAGMALNQLEVLDPDDQVGGSVVRGIYAGLTGDEDDECH